MGAREERGELTRETRNDGAEARQVDVYILITVSLIQETDPTIYFSLCDHVFCVRYPFLQWWCTLCRSLIALSVWMGILYRCMQCPLVVFAP